MVVPANIGMDYEQQLCDEFQTKDGWKSKADNEHLADCETMQLIIPTLVEGIAGKDGLRVLAERLALARPKIAAG